MKVLKQIRLIRIEFHRELSASKLETTKTFKYQKILIKFTQLNGKKQIFFI